MERADESWSGAKAAADAANKAVLKGAAAGVSINFYQYRDCLFLGDAQGLNSENIRSYDDGAWGSLSIGRKGKWNWSKAQNDPGQIELIDYQGNFNQGFFTEALGRVSKKSVDFTSAENVDYAGCPELFREFWAVEPWQGAHDEFRREIEEKLAGENIHFLIDLRAYRTGGPGYLGFPVDPEYLYTRYFEDNSEEYINIDDVLRRKMLEVRENPPENTFDEAEGKVIDDMLQDMYGKWKIKTGY